jgi:hypothetical protein
MRQAFAPIDNMGASRFAGMLGFKTRVEKSFAGAQNLERDD